MRQAISRRYPERDSPFFRMRSRKKLAELLYLSSSKLEHLSRADALYRSFNKPKPSGGERTIDAPRHDLKSVQRRIANLLGRIATPQYLFAPVPGRSYVDNAAAHRGAPSIHLLDVSDFYPNCSANKVIWFFRQRMECSPDIAAIMRALTTHNGSLPQGSPCSPILAYFAYLDMWQEIASLTAQSDCTLSIYVDDMTISGQIVPKKLIWEVKGVLRRHGHAVAVSKERSRHLKPTEITGVIVQGNQLRPPDRSHKLLHDDKQQHRKAQLPEQKALLAAKIRGRRAQMNQILQSTKSASPAGCRFPRK